MKQHLQEVCGLHPDRVFLVPMGVTVQIPEPLTVAQVRASLGLVDNLPVVACIARFSDEKGCEIYLQAIAKVSKAGYHAQFLLVGDGPLRDDLNHLTHDLHLKGYVHITGWREDIFTIISIADFLVLPSLSEAIGIVILEGLYFGKPTIASRVGGIPEVIQDGKNGLLVPPGDPDHLAQASIRLLEKPEYAKQLGLVGKQRAMLSYSTQAMVQQMLETYQILIRQSKTKLRN